MNTRCGSRLSWETHGKQKGLARLVASSGSTPTATGACRAGGGSGDKLGQSQTEERKPRCQRQTRLGGDSTEAAVEVDRPVGYENDNQAAGS